MASATRADRAAKAGIPHTTGKLSRAVYRIPKIGWVLMATRTRRGWTLLVLLPLLALGAREIIRIWRPARGKPHAVAAS